MSALPHLVGIAVSVGLLFGAACAPASAVAPDMIAPLSQGAPRSLHNLPGGAHVALFWRSDCAPCLIELSNFAALRQATRDHAILVALEPVANARRTLARFGVPPDFAYIALASPEAALEAISDGGRRLPYSIALDREGRVRDRHVGLLGTNQAREWMRRCSR